jgi:hypothetical protein
MLEPSEDSAKLTRAPAAGLGGAGGGGEGRVEGIDVEGQIDGVCGPDAVDDLFDDAAGADGVDLAGLDDLEAAVPVVLVVAGPAQRRPDPRVDVGVVGQQPLLGRVVEVRPVVDAGDLGRRAAEYLGSPWVRKKKQVSTKLSWLNFDGLHIQVSRWLSK